MFDWAFVAKYAPFFVNGAWMTLFISVFGIALAILTGIICAAIETARIPVLRQITTVYIEVSRNTPLLVQLYFLYFGLPKDGLRLVRGALRDRGTGVPRWLLHGQNRCAPDCNPCRRSSARMRICSASTPGRRSRG